MKKAVFLDRDGVIIKEKEYAYKIKDCILLPNSAKGLNLLKDFILIIITNQSGIGRKMYTEKDFLKFNNHLVKELAKNKIKIAKTYYCPHASWQDCGCRQPKPKLLLLAKEEFKICLKNSYMIGDKKSDYEFGKNSGLKTVHVLTGYGKKFMDKVNPDFVAKDLLDAAKWIIEDDKKNH